MKKKLAMILIILVTTSVIYSTKATKNNNFLEAKEKLMHSTEILTITNQYARIEVKSIDIEITIELVATSFTPSNAIINAYPGAYIGLRGYVLNKGTKKIMIYGVDFKFKDVDYYAWKSDFEAPVYIDPNEKLAIGSELGESPSFGISDTTLNFWVPSGIPTGSYQIVLGLYVKHKEIYGWVDDGLIWSNPVNLYVEKAPSLEIINVKVNKKELLYGESLKLEVETVNTGMCYIEKARLIVYAGIIPVYQGDDVEMYINPSEKRTFNIEIYTKMIGEGEFELKIIAEIIPGLSEDIFREVYKQTDTYTLTVRVKSRVIAQITLFMIIAIVITTSLLIYKRVQKS